MEHIELLEELRPWDCEQFPKSKTICFGGGGGDPISSAIKTITKPIDDIGTGVNKAVAGLGTPNLPTPDLQWMNEGISHNINQVGGAINEVGDIAMHNIKQIGNIPKLFQGGGKQGAMGGAGAMGPGGTALGAVSGADLAKKKTGMGRRKTLLTG
tara:strand:+ start:7870 stop:8334 length:465 start_codon:yes stop_codon:yes gene_type:complete